MTKKKYSMLFDTNGESLHKSPPYAYHCPGFYQSDEGQLVFVGTQVQSDNANFKELGVATTEAAILIDDDLIRRFVDAVNHGKISIK